MLGPSANFSIRGRMARHFARFSVWIFISFRNSIDEMLDLLGFQPIHTHAENEIRGGANCTAKSVFAGQHDCQHSCGVVVVGGVIRTEAHSVVVIDSMQAFVV